jgi:hypothetical protein
MQNRIAIVVSAVLLGIALAGCSDVSTKSGPDRQETGAAAIIAKWNGKLVRRPGATPEDAKVYLVRDGQKHWVLSSAWMEKHGYKWPDDVYQISAEELDQIPTGSIIE